MSVLCHVIRETYEHGYGCVLSETVKTLHNGEKDKSS